MKTRGVRSLFGVLLLGLMGCLPNPQGLDSLTSADSKGVNIGNRTPTSTSQPNAGSNNSTPGSAPDNGLSNDANEEKATELADMFLNASKLVQNDRVIQFSLSGQVATEACADHEEKRFNFVVYDFGNQLNKRFPGKLPGSTDGFIAPYFPALKNILKTNPKYSSLKIRFATYSSAQEALLPLHAIFNSDWGFPDVIYVTNNNNVRVATPKWLPKFSEKRALSSFATPGRGGTHLITGIYDLTGELDTVARYFRLTSAGTMRKLFESITNNTDQGASMLTLDSLNRYTMKVSGDLLYAHAMPNEYFEKQIRPELAKTLASVKTAPNYLILYPTKKSGILVIDSISGKFFGIPLTSYISNFSHINGTNINKTQHCIL